MSHSAGDRMEKVIPLVEQRAHRRMTMEMSAGVAIMWNPFDFLFRRPSFSCTTRNVSARGLQIVTDSPISAGSTIKLWVNHWAREAPEVLELRGNVCWSNPHASTGKFLAGIRLQDRPERNLALWGEKVRSLIRQHFKPVGATQVA
jgi:hypothetical protein